MGSTTPHADVAAWLADTVAITVLTGAGVSTESGIPDFRGPQGTWTRDPRSAALFDLDTYLADPEARRQVWRMRREHPGWTAEPNAAHRALVELEAAGRLRALITQNIDGLHQRSGSDPARVLEVHGTMHRVVCWSCGLRTPALEVLDRLDEEPDPPCPECGGVQKSDTVSFGQQLDSGVLQAAADAAYECEAFIAVGTSLEVQPVAGLCGAAVEAGATLVIVNAEPTPYDEMADAVLRGPIGDVVPEMVRGALGRA